MDIVAVLYTQIKELDDYLIENGEISLKSAADSNLRKSVLLASASFFESEITGLILSFAEKVTGGNARLVSFVQQKGLARQYHSLFKWDVKNCNTFFSLFGENFKAEFFAHVSDIQKIDAGIKAFMEIGAERNRLVHQNFGLYTIEKTAEEIYQLHEMAKFFTLKLKEFLELS